MTMEKYITLSSLQRFLDLLKSDISLNNESVVTYTHTDNGGTIDIVINPNTILKFANPVDGTINIVFDTVDIPSDKKISYTLRFATTANALLLNYPDVVVKKDAAFPDLFDANTDYEIVYNTIDGGNTFTANCYKYI